VIPAHLSGIILSVGGLDNLPRMRPAYVRGPQPPRPVYTPGPVVGTPITYRSDSNGTRGQPGHTNVANITGGAYDPSDIYSAAAYDYNGLQSVGHCCNPNGVAGGSPPESSIAIAAYGAVQASDIAGFVGTYAHPPMVSNVTAVPIDGGITWSGSNADGETTLDTEWSTATSNSFDTSADTAHVYVYEDAGSPEDMYEAMMGGLFPPGTPLPNYAKIFTTSWSCTEIHGCSGSEMDTRHGLFNQMVGGGWVLMTASGDRGATDDCADIGVSYPASDPDVIGVGGTTLKTDSTFSSEVTWTGGTGSGSCGSNNGGSGGGCSVHYTVPGFQFGANASCGAYRSVPDIALNADWVNSPQNYYFAGALSGTGGTSISSPMLAGFFAQEGAYLEYLDTVTGNKCGPGAQPCTLLGNGNQYLYYFGLYPTFAAHYPFYDVTSGCNTNDIVTTAPPAFCAGPGYDSVTGWGSANMLQLAWAINNYIAGDAASPKVSFSGSPTTGAWYKTTQTVQWSITGESNNGAVSNGVAGYSSAWDSLPPDSSGEATPYTGTADSFYTGPGSPKQTSGSLTLNNGAGNSGEGCHTAHVRAWDNAGVTSDNTYGPVCYDDIAPSVNCGSSDGQWHASNVSIHCTASDPSPGSGLAIPADASFYLTTSVAVDTETSTASTGSHVVSDNAGNKTTAGPIGGNKVDMKPPVVNCGSPDGLWHAANVSIACTASDGGSGLAVPSDSSFSLTTSVPLGTETSSASTNSLGVSDNVGNSTTAGPIGPNKVDRKPPVIIINQPMATTYVHSSTLTLN